MKILQINNASIIRDNLFRNNLKIRVKTSTYNKNSDIYNFINDNYPKKSGIIFCTTQKKCEEFSKYLKNNGLSVDYYHADLQKNKK